MSCPALCAGRSKLPVRTRTFAIFVWLEQFDDKKSQESKCIEANYQSNEMSHHARILRHVEVDGKAQDGEGLPQHVQDAGERVPATDVGAVYDRGASTAAT